MLKLTMLIGRAPNAFLILESGGHVGSLAQRDLDADSVSLRKNEGIHDSSSAFLFRAEVRKHPL